MLLATGEYAMTRLEQKIGGFVAKARNRSHKKVPVSYDLLPRSSDLCKA